MWVADMIRSRRQVEFVRRLLLHLTGSRSTRAHPDDTMSARNSIDRLMSDASFMIMNNQTSRYVTYPFRIIMP